MENLSFTTNQDIIALLCQRLKEYRLAACKLKIIRSLEKDCIFELL